MAKSSDDANVDLRVPVAVHVESLAWLPSPSPTVWRRTLYREGGEFGPVTSVVRYDARSAFAPHSHPEGEEILVLEGVFSDEHGDYPAGTYLLNPPGSSHKPASREGCVLFVRLRQYGGEGRLARALDTNALDWTATDNADVLERPLYAQAGFPETISLQQWRPGARVSIPGSDRPREILVLEGAVESPLGVHPATSWLRWPASSGGVELQAPGGARVYCR
ncbi:hypothetical protein BWI17_01905 [Betaproteobacteria bacterium GR16-43]|nr:hypothetical protein BWI17_01905 [Betaproteobacteria bacterium GR16-43]